MSGGLIVSLSAILMFPAIMLRLVVGSIVEKYSLIRTVTDMGGEVSFLMYLRLLGQILLVGFIFFVLGLICWDTIKRVMVVKDSESSVKSFFINLVISAATLFIYYFLIAIGLYVFVNVLIPVCRGL